MSTKQSGSAAHNAACNAAEAVRQVAVQAAGNSQSAAIAAEVTFYRAVIASSKANNNFSDVSVANTALRALGFNS
jgi:hypothetical protein